MALDGSYIDVDEFKTRTIMPAEDVDYLESSFPGYLASRLQIATSRINARLMKLYAVPFALPAPAIVIGWLIAIVTVEAYQKRGWNTSDEQSKDIVNDAATAFGEIKEAAESKDGLFELPLRQDLPGSGARTKGGPLAYSDTSPYAFTTRQREANRGR